MVKGIKYSYCPQGDADFAAYPLVMTRQRSEAIAFTTSVRLNRNSLFMSAKRSQDISWKLFNFHKYTKGASMGLWMLNAYLVLHLSVIYLTRKREGDDRSPKK